MASVHEMEVYLWLVSFAETRNQPLLIVYSGEIVGLEVLGRKIVVLNSQRALNELLEKRATSYSDRPVATVVGELMGLDQVRRISYAESCPDITHSLVLKPYGPEWRECRKLARMALNPTAVKGYHTMQERFAGMLASELLERPSDFYNLVRL